MVVPSYEMSLGEWGFPVMGRFRGSGVSQLSGIWGEWGGRVLTTAL